MLAKYRRRWRNWSGLVEAVPNFRSYPVSLEEIQAEVLRAADDGERLRVGGSGQSFTPLCWTDENLMSLDYFTGIESMDMQHRRVWVRSGTRLVDLANQLSERGLAQVMLGASGQQTLAGAISTGTHGSGVDFGNMSTQVTALRMVCADGSVRTISAESNKPLFDAARLSLGALGVITHVELQCVDAYRLHYRSSRDQLGPTLRKLDKLKRSHRHFEFAWYPNNDNVQLRFMDTTVEPLSPLNAQRLARNLVLENGAMWALSTLTRRMPGSREAAQRMTTWAASNDDVIGEPNLRYDTKRIVRFVESAYAIPAKFLPEALKRMESIIRALRFKTHLPVEVRFVKADDIWLSPCYERDSAIISVSAPVDVPHQDYFNAMAEIFERYEGRPHWGKLHDKTADDLLALYPRFADFQKLRKELDPRGVFLNPHLCALFGVDQL
ncbi:D-arabinono-1,4-lactone oxidase [Stenotrophobium rhamnosiphilum]|uniref:FAD-binding oxidoreductase n=1 Tax=Stenotrophobium rhamnosiphilum TaxID=2029166 RepID=A0A2T5MIL6_9GAMM|nr:D-arabinono-1,4-lactone oxidase [Stenotrophobium rhamnosiphilum]PTU32422.1 FAD-binding oxidoreductase [Stenotrophobium rhamnosiphilum]